MSSRRRSSVARDFGQQTRARARWTRDGDPAPIAAVRSLEALEAAASVASAPPTPFVASPSITKPLSVAVTDTRTGGSVRVP